MAKLTRRMLIMQTTLGVSGAAALGALFVAPRLQHSAAVAAPAERSACAPDEQMVLQVRNCSTGEVSLMVGEREITFRDQTLVARLLKAAS